VGWKDAIKRMADRISDIKQRYGEESIAFIRGSFKGGYNIMGCSLQDWPISWDVLIPLQWLLFAMSPGSMEVYMRALNFSKLSEKTVIMGYFKLIFGGLGV